MARPGFKDHRKFKRLVAMLREPIPHVLGYVQCMWESAYEAGSDFIGDEADVALLTHFPGSPEKICNALLDCGGIGQSGLIEPAETPGTYRIHDLYDNAPEYVRKRLKRAGERKSNNDNGSVRRTADNGRRAAVNGRPPSPPAPLPPRHPSQEHNPSSADADGQANKPSCADSDAQKAPADQGTPRAKRTPAAYTGPFESWYIAYPRKVGKQAASAAYGRAIARICTARSLSRDDAHTWLVERTMAFAKSPSGNRGEYTPHPATWLNDGRFDDDPAEWSRPEHSHGTNKPTTTRRGTF